MPLAELEYDHTMHERQYAGDEKLFVHFYMEVLPDEEQSKATGMRKFRDAEMVRIIVPGSKTNIIDREVRDDDRERFAKQYERFKAGEEEQLEGYPLKEWPLVSRSMAEEFKYLGFRTVEQIALASDGVVGKYPGMRDVQRRAQAWLEAQKSAAPLEKLQTELQSRDEQIATLQAQMQEMAKLVASLKAPAEKAK